MLSAHPYSWSPSEVEGKLKLKVQVEGACRLGSKPGHSLHFGGLVPGVQTRDLSLQGPRLEKHKGKHLFK